jgi:outer membrane protein insertion porin family
VGWGGEDVPLFERFFLGGANSIRSFQARDVSPKDSAGDEIGGNIQVLGNVEYLIPLGFGFRLLVFYDVGNVWGPDIPGAVTLTTFDITDVRHAAGLGIRWLSPFGPLRAEYGFNLDRKKGEKSGQFHFSVGTAF